MLETSHVTAILLVPPADDGATAELYRKDTGEGGLLAASVAAAASWPVDDVVVVLGADGEELLDVITEGVDVLLDPEWEEGPASSLRAGFDLVVRGDVSDAVLLCSIDRPLPEPELIDELRSIMRAEHRPIVAAKYRYALDYPYLVHSDVWGRVLGMEGTASIGTLAATHPEWVADAWVDAVPPKPYRTAEDIGRRR